MVVKLQVFLASIDALSFITIKCILNLKKPMCIHQIQLRLIRCEFYMAVSTMYQHFGGMYCLCVECRPENRCGRSFQNVGTCLPRHEASHPWRPHYSSAELCLIAVCASNLLVLHCKYLFKILLPYYSLLWFKTFYLSKYLLEKM